MNIDSTNQIGCGLCPLLLGNDCSSIKAFQVQCVNAGNSWCRLVLLVLLVCLPREVRHSAVTYTWRRDITTKVVVRSCINQSNGVQVRSDIRTSKLQVSIVQWAGVER